MNNMDRNTSLLSLKNMQSPFVFNQRDSRSPNGKGRGSFLRIISQKESTTPEGHDNDMHRSMFSGNLNKVFEQNILGTPTIQQPSFKASMEASNIHPSPLTK
jgi:hypothetical protein